ncbi:MAG: GTPase [Alphaproteobacteria bacterium]|nr:GTPase [Alphaproteobacteria bacterium]
MRLKTFYATTMTEAMQMIRESLGDEAIIVATGDQPARGGVRVTAAVEPSFEIGNDTAASESWLQYDDEQDTDAVAEELTDILLRHTVSEEVMDHIVSCATVMGFDDLKTALIFTLEQLYRFTPLPRSTYKQPIMLIGPPGSGKTLATAKIATRGTMNDLNIGVISTDTLRAGGIEQLQAFTKLLDIDLQKAKTPQDLRAITKDLQQYKDQILIDTSGLNPFDTSDIKVLAKLMAVIDAKPVLVLPAGLDADEAGEMGRVFATIGAREILPTRVDVARRLGSLLCAAHQGDLAFCDVSHTSKVPDGLAPLTPKSLAQLLVPRLYQQQKSDILQPQSHPRETRKTGTYQS